MEDNGHTHRTIDRRVVGVCITFGTGELETAVANGKLAFKRRFGQEATAVAMPIELENGRVETGGLKIASYSQIPNMIIVGVETK